MDKYQMSNSARKSQKELENTENRYYTSTLDLLVVRVLDFIFTPFASVSIHGARWLCRRISALAVQDLARFVLLPLAFHLCHELNPPRNVLGGEGERRPPPGQVRAGFRVGV